MHCLWLFGLFVFCRLVGCVWRLCQKLTWEINGTNKILEAGKSPTNFNTSAQLLKVRFRNALDPPFQRNSTRNFLLTHHGFVNPRYVLKDEVSLYYVNSEEAVFVEASPGVEVWKSQYKGAFHKVAQHQYAVNIIKMPFHAFYKLADELGGIKETLIFSFYTPRSGSTLLCSILEQSGECVTFSDANVFHSGGHPFSDHFNKPNAERCLWAEVRLLCKPRKQGQNAFYFKIHPPMFGIFQSLSNVFPDAKFLFQYRNGIPCISSMYKMMRVSTEFQIADLFYGNFSVFKKRIIKYVGRGISIDPYIHKLLSTTGQFYLATAVFRWAHAVNWYQQNGPPAMGAVKYEDLLDNALASISAILEFLGLQANKAGQAVQSLEKDSQVGSPLSRERFSWINTPQNIMNNNNIFDIVDFFGVPKMENDCRLTNTITCPKQP